MLELFVRVRPGLSHETAALPRTSRFGLWRWRTCGSRPISSALGRTSRWKAPINTGESGIFPVTRRHEFCFVNFENGSVSHRDRELTTAAIPSSALAGDGQQDGVAGASKPIREILRNWQRENGASSQTNLEPDQATAIEGAAAEDDNELDFRIDPGEEKHSADAWMSQDSASAGIQLGDMCELHDWHSPNHKTELAVVVRTGRREHYFYTIAGKWVLRRVQSVRFSVPSLITPRLAREISNHIPEVVTGLDIRQQSLLNDMSVPREVGKAAVDKLKEFSDECDKIYRSNSSVLDGAHRILARLHRIVIRPLPTVTLLLLHKVGNSRRKSVSIADVTYHELYTVHRALTNAGICYEIGQPLDRVNTPVSIRSRRQIELMTKVLDMVRNFNEINARMSYRWEDPSSDEPSSKDGFIAISAFLKKATWLIDLSRHARELPQSWRVGPCREPSGPDSGQNNSNGAVEVAQFTAEEQSIIRFLEMYSLTTAFERHEAMSSAASALLRATNRYAELPHDAIEAYGRGAAQLFLQEIGSVPPYINPTLYSEELMIPHLKLDPSVAAMEAKLKELERTESRGFSDAFKGKRKDWGDLPAYCIDNAGAAELDDAISVEQVPGMNGHSWIHVHVANPAAFFPWGHAIANMAYHMIESLYLPDARFSMMPDWVSRDHFSLAPDRPVMTTSMKVDESGNILEVEMQPGTIRNCISITYDDCQHLFEATATPERNSRQFSIGPPMAALPTRERVLSAREQEDLLLIGKIMSGRCRRKNTSDRNLTFMQKPRISVGNLGPQHDMTFPTEDRSRALLMHGDPSISVSFAGEAKAGSSERVTSATQMVSEAMAMACEATGRWCRDRNVPSLFRVTTAYEQSATVRDFLEKHSQEFEEATATGGSYAWLAGVQMTQGQNTISTVPKYNPRVQTDTYVRVTSPLRRLPDLIQQWQIQAALLYEDRTGTSLANRPQPVTENKVGYPFTTGQLQMMQLRIRGRESQLRDAAKRAQEMWLSFFLYRVVHYKEQTSHSTFPETVKFHVTTERNVRGLRCVSGQIPELQLLADMSLPEGTEGVGRGEPQHNTSAAESQEQAKEEAVEEEEVRVRLGDVWEARWERIEFPGFRFQLSPVRLVERNERLGRLLEKLPR